MTLDEIMQVIAGLKVNDQVIINGWAKHMRVVGVSKRYVLAHNGQEYTIIDKEPTEYKHNGIPEGAIVCAPDWWCLGWIGGYKFDEPKWVDGYMQSLENGETGLSRRMMQIAFIRVVV